MWVHVLPGRVRARVAGVQRNPVLAAQVARSLLAQLGIQSAAASAVTGTVLLTYDPTALTLQQLALLLAAVPGMAAAEAAATLEPALTAAAPAPPPPAPDPTATGPGGLTTAEAERRLVLYGPNVLPEPPRPSFLTRLAGQYRDTMQLTLLAGAGVALLSGHRRDALTIGAVLLLNGLIGAREAGQASRPLAALRALNQGPVRVIRDGAEQVLSAAALVPGDLLVLEAGDRAPADAQVVKSVGLGTDERLLTGENAAVAKGPGDLFSGGTSVVSGRGLAVVTATGPASTIGRIAGLLERRQRPTPLQRDLDGLGRRITRAGLWLAAGATGIGLLRGQGVLPALLSGVSLAISAVPEGLLSFVTLALAFGARRISQRNGSSQNLATVETMGAVTALCCDKTGTLTYGEMTATEVFTPDARWQVTGSGYSPEGEFIATTPDVEPGRNPGLRRLLAVGALCNNARLGVDGDGALVGAGDPTELALLVAALKGGLRACGGEGQRLLEVPFDAGSKRMTVVCRDGAGRATACAKGAVEAVVPLCTGAFAGGAVRPLDRRLRRRCERAAAGMAARGLRVLAVAYKPVPVTAGPEDVAGDLILAGLVGLSDPPRPEAAAMVGRCEQAGVRVLMITGDHPATAAAIARQIGLPAGPGAVLTGEQLAGLGDAELDGVIGQVAVVARATPEQKVRVVQALRRTGNVVAMTGDGVNDAPAMQAADVGIAMGSQGAAVARATAGLVLEDDRLETVVAAIVQGRATGGNVRRMARYLLGANAAEVCLLAASLALGLPLPLLPVQLLWMNLAGDLLPATALGTEPPHPDLIVRPQGQGDPLGPRFGRQVLSHGLRVGLAATGIYGLALLTGRPLVRARTLAMVTLAAGQLRNLFACRSPGHNPQVRKAGTLAATLTLAAIYLPPLRGPLQFAPVGLGELAFATATALAASGG